MKDDQLNASFQSVRCHYDVLGIPRDADATTIKKAYRKLALQYHPDKNIVVSGDHTNTSEEQQQQNDRTVLQKKQLYEQLFLQVQQAYECLSDTAERKWYDDHRDAILKGWTVSTGTGATGTSSRSGNGDPTSTDGNNDIIFNVVPYMYAGCFSGFHDHDAHSFYHVYQSVFQQVYQGEVEGCSNIRDVEYLAVPFGTSTSNYDTVVAVFYQAWESFSSILSYTWADQWNVQEAEQRRVRRAMEEDNLRARRKARKVRNDEILTLIRFVKRRDPRVIARKEEQEYQKLVRDQELKEVIKQRRLEKEKAMEEWREQSEREALAAEEDDRLRGRVRLADLEDDYDYGGGKKRGKGKKNRNKLQYEDGSGGEKRPEGEGEGEPSGNAIPKEAATMIDVEHPNVDDTVDEVNAEVLDTQLDFELNIPDWRCECCLETFADQKQMLNHFKSKKHKDMAASRKVDKCSSTTNIGSNYVDNDDAIDDRKSKKKNKKNVKQTLSPSDDDFGNHAESESGNIIRDATHLEYNVKSKRVSPLMTSAPKHRIEAPVENSGSHVFDGHESETEEVDDDDDDDSSVAEPGILYDDEPLFWRCECCQKDFQSEGQMENHMNSKKHKAAYRKYERIVGKKLLYDVVEELQQTKV
jgi:curved DNA-binding protein CbpA